MTDTNNVVIIGRLTRDAEMKYTNSGLAVSSFSIAMSKSIKQNDQWVDTTIFINDLSLFGKRAEGLNQYLTKGKQVAINGCLDVDNWEQDGKKRSKLKVHISDIQLLGGKSASPQQQSAPQGQQQASQGSSDRFDDSDIPF